MDLKIYDKVKWHYPEGKGCPDLKTAINIFTVLMEWLNKNNFLSENGKEELELGIESDFSLTSIMLTQDGNIFLEKYYKKWLNSIDYNSELSIDVLESFLNNK